MRTFFIWSKDNWLIWAKCLKMLVTKDTQWPCVGETHKERNQRDSVIASCCQGNQRKRCRSHFDEDGDAQMREYEQWSTLFPRVKNGVEYMPRRLEFCSTPYVFLYLKGKTLRNWNSLWVHLKTDKTGSNELDKPQNIVCVSWKVGK